MLGFKEFAHVQALSADLDSIFVRGGVGLDHWNKMLLTLSTCSRSQQQERNLRYMQAEALKQQRSC